MKNRMKTLRFCLLTLLGVISVVPAVYAGEYTDVIDAFDNDNGDPFDLTLSVGYERFQEKGTITRETYADGVAHTDETLHSWDYYPKYKFGEYEHSQNILNLKLDIGLYKDIALNVHLPIILSDDRSLSGDANAWPSSAETYFDESLRSPQRSGVDYLSVGLSWSPLDQSRKKEYPTLTGVVEGRFGVGKELTAACDAGQDCGADFETDGGISRGLNQLRLGLHFSRRYGAMEPYMGIDAMLGWFKASPPSVDTGALNDMPPIEGTFDFGMEIVPWEVPDKEQKLVIYLGGSATYVSEGRDRTPLFDALGTSSFFTDPTDGYADLDDDPTTETSQELQARQDWDGMTDIENYARFYGKFGVAIQPAKYVKFNIGTNLGHNTEHFITKTDQCPAGEVNDQGVCENYNKGHRPVIDKPGTRFRAEKVVIWALFIDAVAQF